MSGEQKQKRDDPKYLSTGCDPLDNLLGGGFQRGVVSQIYGSPGTGKSNICLQASVETIKSEGSVVYIDTEGISMERFKQIAGEGYEEISREFIVKEVYDFDEQNTAVKDVEDLAPQVDLIVLDSATGLYRVEPEPENEEERPLRRLTRQITHLTSLARRHNLAVVITNQIYTQVETENEDYRPLGGNMIQHWTKAIVRLDKLNQNRRRATLKKHLSKSTGGSVTFLITDTGIEGVN
ncbi:MAG: DNA repair and recombination protein RadB [Halobacteria archaeon]|nr:DNA repair and recombination protein RadB [Halobacteria archaeon]